MTNVKSPEPVKTKQSIWIVQYMGWTKTWRFDESFWKDVTTRTISASIAAGVIALVGLGIAAALGWISQPDVLLSIGLSALWISGLCFLLAAFLGAVVLFARLTSGLPPKVREIVFGVGLAAIILAFSFTVFFLSGWVAEVSPRNQP
ncbi:hypothetical protein E3O62_02590 [Cryobacterium sp. TMT2-15-1]|uniref:hypothetical protein n=1 Tax=Cryobacterium sp. TMT2-15-1 TaxID=1259246 RepID=UPI00106B6364|nr:hypothetical protein [Cryobacterium sp. TMT2-15-1]TFC63733.1 hypothetical protein E3O62_02590 [Cryobacterium sp. TMT2-15-1]